MNKKYFENLLKLNAEDGTGGAGGTDGTDKPSTPTMEELQAQLEELKKSNDSLKNANNNLSKENKQYKDKSRENLSEQERLEAERQQREEENNKLIKELQEKNNCNTIRANISSQLEKVGIDNNDDLNGFISALAQIDEDNLEGASLFISDLMKKSYEKGQADKDAENVSNSGKGTGGGNPSDKEKKYFFSGKTKVENKSTEDILNGLKGK